MRTVIVDPLSSGSIFLERALELSLEVALVFTSPVGDAFAAQFEECRGRLPTDRVWIVPRDCTRSDLDARLLRDWAGAQVICGSEPGVRVADLLREQLGSVPRNVGSLAASRADKYAAQMRLSESGLASISSRRISSESEVSACAESLEFPVVVKPANSAGSEGVQLAASVRELGSIVAEWSGRTNTLGDRIDFVVVQECLSGTEYVIDGVLTSDGCVFSSVGRYEKRWSSKGPIYRSLTWVDWTEIPRWTTLADYVRECLKALGVRVGSFHFEVFDTGSNWVMVEVGLRPHGGGHPRYTERFTGSSQVMVELGGPVLAEWFDYPPSLGSRGRVVFLDVEVPCTLIRDPVFTSDSGATIIDAHIVASSGDELRPAMSLIDTVKLGFVVVGADSSELLDHAEKKIRCQFLDCLSTSN